MNRLWFVEFRVAFGDTIMPFSTLLRATTESRARSLIAQFIDENNGTVKTENFEIYDYLVTRIEPYDETTHGPEHLYGQLNDLLSR